MLLGVFMIVENHRDKNSRTDLEKIAEQYYMAIYKYCYVRLGVNSTYSYDITNEIFALLCEKWGKIKIKNARAWLYRTADNVIKEFLRKDKTKIKEIKYLDELDEYTTNELSYEQDFEKISNEDIEMSKEKILEKLSDKERKLFDMAFIENLPRKKICEILLISEETLKKQLYRLRQKINESVSLVHK